MQDQNQTPAEGVSDTQTSEQNRRRKAVKNILIAGGGVLTASQLGNAKWAKPVMNSVILPAHALTTGEVETETASDPGFSVVDPAVYLTYVCGGGGGNDDVIADIGGSLDVQAAGIKVHLVLSWAPVSGETLTEDSSPTMIDVVTAADGTFSSTGHNLGHKVGSVSVTASLTDFPGSGTANDTINPGNDGPSAYYCSTEITED